MPFILSLLKNFIFLRIAGKIIASLAVLIPIALILALFGIPTLAILGIIGTPLMIFLMILGLPIIFVLLFTGVAVFGVAFLLPFAVLVLKVCLWVILPLILIRWAWKNWLGPDKGRSEPGVA